MPEHSPTDGEPSARGGLGRFLAELRKAKGLTLRDVEEATRDNDEIDEVSNAYVSQLENGKVTDPSPHILHMIDDRLPLVAGNQHNAIDVCLLKLLQRMSKDCCAAEWQKTLRFPVSKMVYAVPFPRCENDSFHNRFLLWIN